MTREVVWSRDALDDLKVQVAYIATDNPDAAQRVAQGIREAAAALGKIPTGRPGRVVGTYEKSVARLPYVIAYAISVKADSEAVVIVRVIHTARNRRSGQWPEASEE